ncbi:hypothetical protein [Methylocella sp.]|uniref:hypothetical protein n=1 Tax=Methylocella sp. TaxID=1978226 RepID=UPI0037836331
MGHGWQRVAPRPERAQRRSSTRRSSGTGAPPTSRQAKGPMENPIEMNATVPALAVLNYMPEYVAEFRSAFRARPIR